MNTITAPGVRQSLSHTKTITQPDETVLALRAALARIASLEREAAEMRQHESVLEVDNSKYRRGPDMAPIHQLQMLARKVKGFLPIDDAVVFETLALNLNRYLWEWRVNPAVNWERYLVHESATTEADLPF